MAWKTNKIMKIGHRYLGFFLAGIMAMYALSGVVMIFRTTDFLQKERKVEIQLEKNIAADKLGEALKMRRFNLKEEANNIIYFENGSYDKTSGKAEYTVKSLPFLLDKMTQVHKATTNSPLFWLNIFFGISLLFFVISAFWMFKISTSIFKNGMYFTLGGIILMLIILFV